MEIKLEKKNIIIGAVYRPPDKHLNVFIDELDSLTNDFNSKNKQCILIGDFNIDLLHDASDDYVNMLMSNGLKQCITNMPTRLC